VELEVPAPSLHTHTVIVLVYKYALAHHFLHLVSQQVSFFHKAHMLAAEFVALAIQNGCGRVARFQGEPKLQRVFTNGIHVGVATQDGEPILASAAAE